MVEGLAWARSSARHVYQAGSLVGGDSVGCCRNTAPNASSITAADPTTTQGLDRNRRPGCGAS